MAADPNVQLVLDCHTDLGESPVWDARTGRLYFVDINEKQIHVYTPSDKQHFTIDAPVSLCVLKLLHCTAPGGPECQHVDLPGWHFPPYLSYWLQL